MRTQVVGLAATISPPPSRPINRVPRRLKCHKAVRRRILYHRGRMQRRWMRRDASMTNSLGAKARATKNIEAGAFLLIMHVRAHCCLRTCVALPVTAFRRVIDERINTLLCASCWPRTPAPLTLCLLRFLHALDALRAALLSWKYATYQCATLRLEYATISSIALCVKLNGKKKSRGAVYT